MRLRSLSKAADAESRVYARTRFSPEKAAGGGEISSPPERNGLVLTLLNHAHSVAGIGIRPRPFVPGLFCDASKTRQTTRG
jgi:hypothetical protein